MAAWTGIAYEPSGPRIRFIARCLRCGRHRDSDLGERTLNEVGSTAFFVGGAPTCSCGSDKIRVRWVLR